MTQANLAIWATVIGGGTWYLFFYTPPLGDPDAEKTWTLVILSNGMAVVPRYEDMAACSAAGMQLPEQPGNVSQPVTACIIAGSKDPYR